MDSNVLREMNRRCRACLIDTREFLAVRSVVDVERRCNYVFCLIQHLDYPLLTLPWEQPVNEDLVPQAEQHDLENLYAQLRQGLSDLDYNGEEIVISPSKNNWVIVHFLQGEFPAWA